MNLTSANSQIRDWKLLNVQHIYITSRKVEHILELIYFKISPSMYRFTLGFFKHCEIRTEFCVLSSVMFGILLLC